MNNSKPHKVFEHDTLKYNVENFLTESHFDALVKFNERNDNKFFTVVNKGIKFKQYVGIIRVGNLTIEILPKIDKDKNEDLAHSFLIDMLLRCKKLRISSVSKTNLKIRYNNLLEYFLQSYLNELESLLKIGLIKKYRFVRENKTVLKGKLLVSKQICKNLINKEKFYIRYQKYDYNNILNNILFEALKIIPAITSNKSIINQQQQLLLLLPDLSGKNITAESFDRIKYDRRSKRYEPSIQLAKMIILNYNPDLSKGSNNIIAILFDMNKLFEEYVYRILKRTAQDKIKVEAQRQKTFWKKKIIKPDILVTKEEKKYIIDTKWKIIKANDPSDNDLKQMFVYNEFFDTGESILLYPNVSQLESAKGLYNEKLHSCRLEFIDLVRSGTINKNIGEEILEMLN